MIKYSRFCNSPQWEQDDDFFLAAFFVSVFIGLVVSVVAVWMLISGGNILGAGVVVSAFLPYCYLFFRVGTAPFASWHENKKQLWRAYLKLSDIERAEFARLTPQEVDSMSPQAAAATLNAMNDALNLFRSTNASKITMNEKAKEFANSIQSRKDYYNTLEGKSID